MFTENRAIRREPSLFIEDFRGQSPAALLEYFQSRRQAGALPLAPGKKKHFHAAEQILNNTFDLNNECYLLGEKFDWLSNPSKDLEWLILLHKFYYFKELAGAYDFSRDERYAIKWVSLIDSWITQVHEGFIDSQVTGRRLQQWLLSYRYFLEKGCSPSVTAGFLMRFLRSVDSQTHYLCEHLTPEGNHRTLELYAIFLGGGDVP